jgi:hypothetical protein
MKWAQKSGKSRKTQQAGLNPTKTSGATAFAAARFAAMSRPSSFGRRLGRANRAR